MGGAAMLVSLVSLGGGEEPPPPRVEPGAIERSDTGPVEGPAPPPESTREPEPPGIEFAPTEQIEPESGSDSNDADPWTVAPPEAGGADGEGAAVGEAKQDLWPEPGQAPKNGSGAFMAGALLLPSVAIWTALLLQNPRLSSDDRRNIWIASGTLGGLALGGFALGGYRQAKLRKWAAAYRVVPTRQGGALITLGSFGLGLGLTGVPVGGFWLARGDSATGGLITAVGAVSLGVITPLGLYFGLKRRHAYVESGGWVRRPLPQVQLAPRLLISRDVVGLGIAGCF